MPGGGVDYIKVDDLSQPYSTAEIEAIRRAIDKCGRPIVFSTSPGETNIEHAEHIKTQANLWRISGDFWDRWQKLDRQFDLIARWQGQGGIGHWPDGDMIPFGHLCIRSLIGGKDHWTNFTKDEQRALITLWALMPSPLMLGMNLPDNDEWTLSLLTNDEVLAVNQDSKGRSARRISQKDRTEVWMKELADGTKAAGFFNRGEQETPVTLTWGDAGLSGKQFARDLWQGKDIGSFNEQIGMSVPAHGALLVRLTSEK